MQMAAIVSIYHIFYLFNPFFMRPLELGGSTTDPLPLVFGGSLLPQLLNGKN
jgi:hypothetical protein